MGLGISSGLVTGLVLAFTSYMQQPAVMRALPPEISHQSEDDWIN